VLSEFLISGLHKLTHTDKLRAMQLLIADLVLEEDIGLQTASKYDLFTPYGNETAAQVLTEFLESDRNKTGQ